MENQTKPVGVFPFVEEISQTHKTQLLTLAFGCSKVRRDDGLVWHIIAGFLLL